MPKDFYEDRRVKNLPAHLQGPLVKALETQAAADVYDDLAQELAEQRQLRKDLPSLVK